MTGFISLPGEGAPLNALGIPLVLRGSGDETGGALGVIEVDFPPGVPFPAHIHRNSAEAFYVLGGEITAIVGDRRLDAGAGTFAFAPAGVVHGFENNGTETARVLAWQWPPPDFASFVAALEELGPEADPEQMGAILARFDIEPVG